MTSSDLPSAVSTYIDMVESDTPRACRDQHALCAYVRHVFDTEDLSIDEELLAKYLGLAKYFPFERLYPWEEFLFTLWNCTFKSDGQPRWDTVFCLIGRGAGKDGYIAFDSFASVSPYNVSDHYNVDICANNEEQAMTPVRDIIETLETPKYEAKLRRHYYHTKELVQGRANKGVILGRTNSPKGRDGMRSGKIIFNEVHQYQNYDNINVFTTGLGKRKYPRTGFFTSNGDVSDGPLDDKLALCMDILYEGAPDNGLLPFLCRLDKLEDVHDPENWSKANPSLFYSPALKLETAKEYSEWLQHPEQHGSFITKRMNLRTGAKDIAVTDYEKVKGTNKPLPDLTGWSCTVGLDYAELSDWAAVNLHFRRGAERYDINHAWICRDSKTLPRVKAPWRAWVDAGHCTYVEDVSINPDLLADYIAAAGTQYNLRILAMDNYRWTLVSESMRKVGFDAADKSRVKLIRPSDIMQTEPVIQECFDRGLLTWGDNPCLRWATNNTKRVASSKKIGSDTGNYYYAKIEAKSRKTDPFMAFVASMCAESALGACEPLTLPPIGGISL